MLADYAANPAANWKSKDCATYLVVALTVRGRTATAGATATNELVNVLEFFRQQMVPDLQASRWSLRARSQVGHELIALYFCLDGCLLLCARLELCPLCCTR
jgi:Cse1